LGGRYKLNTSENTGQALRGVSETLLLPLYFRAIESQRPDALIKDDIAVRLVSQADFDFSRIKQASHDEESQVAVVLRNREFDRITSDFLINHPKTVVVHLGCGLDARFDRVDNGQVAWYDLDLPEIIDLRRKFIGEERERYHFLASSIFEDEWMDIVATHLPYPFLFLGEGILMYFAEEQVKALVLMLLKRFPGAELVFDAFSPFFVWANNRRVARTGFGATAHWALKHSKELESWGDGIQLISEWYPFLCPEPRLRHIRWARHISLLSKTMGIFHYRLGKYTAG